MELEQLTLLTGWNSNARILNYYFQESLLSDTETLTLPFSGVYFSEFDKMFLELNPFSPCQTTHSNN